MIEYLAAIFTFVMDRFINEWELGDVFPTLLQCTHYSVQ